MTGPRKLKEILAEVAETFGVTKKRAWDAVKRASGGTGRGWNSQLYVRRTVTVLEATMFNLPRATVVLTAERSHRPSFFIYPSSYKDKDRVERPTVCASSYAYLSSVGINAIPPPTYREGTEKVDGHIVPVQIRESVFDEDDLDTQEP